MNERMSLSTRIAVGYAVVLAAIFIVTLAAAVALNANRAGVGALWTTVQDATSIQDVRLSLSNYTDDVRDYVTFNQSTYLSNAERDRQAYEKAWSGYVASHDSAASIDVAVRDVGDAGDRVIALKKSNASTAEVQDALSTLLARGNTLGSALGRIEVASQQQSARLQASTSNAAATAMTVTVAVGVIGLLVGLVVAIGVVRSTASRLLRAIGAISAASTQFSEAAKHQANGSSQQAAAVGEITATMEELSRTADQIADSAEQTLESAENGRMAVGDALEGMDRIKTKVEAMARRILALGEKSHEIGEIIEIINDIADKTHLLAINAAIESAAAGEFGRRFAVVASQVKELADESKDATKQVKTIVGEIQQATNALVMATEDATKEADVGSELAGRSGGAIDEIVQMIHTISLATQQQRTASEQVVSTMHEIAGVARDSAGGSAEAAKGAEQLSETAEQLRQMVGGIANTRA